MPRELGQILIHVSPADDGHLIALLENSPLVAAVALTSGVVRQDCPTATISRRSVRIVILIQPLVR